MSMTIEEAGVVRPGFPKPFPNIPNNVLEQFQMKGKVTVVNGAADGIGLAVASAIAEAGGNVALWYNSNNAALTRAEEIAKEFGVKTKAYQVAVENPDAVEKTMDQVVSDFGKIDVFVANAGMAISKPILETTLPEYDKQMSINGETR
jgi:sorbose reductase